MQNKSLETVLMKGYGDKGDWNGEVGVLLFTGHQPVPGMRDRDFCCSCIQRLSRSTSRMRAEITYIMLPVVHLVHIKDVAISDGTPGG